MYDDPYQSRVPPWDIGRPQKTFIQLMNEKAFSGTILDIGCGTGENALHLAANGLTVKGIDRSAAAIDRAREKAKQRGLENRVSFEVLDVFNLSQLHEEFDGVIDSGLLHNFTNPVRMQIVEQVRKVLKPNAKFHILAFNEYEPYGAGPPNRLSSQDISQLFSSGWGIINIREAQFESNLPKKVHNAWLTVVQKVGS